MEETRAIICPQCGATDVAAQTNERFQCNRCGSTFDVKKDAAPTVVVNNTTVVNKTVVSNEAENKLDGPIAVGVYEPSGDETEFLRNAYHMLAFDESTPEDILSNSKFAPVEHCINQFAVFKTKSKVTYSATIGYDRIEQYVDYETKTYYENGRSYQKTVPVTKQRTVTDWHPTSGEKEVTENVYIQLAGDGLTYEFIAKQSEMNKHIVDFENTKIELPEVLSPTAADKMNAIKKGSSQAESTVMSELPGDHSKDFSAHSTTELINYYICIVPELIQKYTYADSNETSEIRLFNGAVLPYKVNPPCAENISENKLIKQYEPVFGANFIDLSYKLSFNRNYAEKGTLFYELMKRCNTNARNTLLMFAWAFLLMIVAAIATGESLGALIIIPIPFVVMAIISRRKIFAFEKGKALLKNLSAQKRKREDLIKLYADKNLKQPSETSLNMIYDEKKNLEVMKKQENNAKWMKIIDIFWKYACPVAYGLIALITLLSIIF